MLFRLMLLLCVSMTFINVGAQNNLTKEQREMRADSAYISGDYEEARQQYRFLWAKYEDYEARKLVDNCSQCIDLLSNAMAAEREKKYDLAISKYREVLRINPRDNKAPELIESCKYKMYEPILDEATQLYKAGAYIKALNKLEDYTRLSGLEDINLSSAIRTAIDLTNQAKKAEIRNDYTAAKNKYEQLLRINPTDVVSARAIAEINRRTQTIVTNPSSNKIISKDKGEKGDFSLRPLKNRCNMFIYSGFSAPVAIGGGIGFNISYFNVSIDAGGCDVDDIYTRGRGGGMLAVNAKKNCVQLEDGTFVQGKAQIALTPGVNLKYFGIGIGVGAMLTKELSDADITLDYYFGDISSRSHFLLRPTLTGYIPFNKDFSGGFSIMAGYNIVSGVSGLNQFILGIGFFF